MEKEFAPYELALRMKQLGFDEPCLGIHIEWENEEIETCLMFCAKQDNASMASDNGGVLAPTFSQAFRWFRTNYGYWSYIKEATKGTCRFYIEKFDEKFFNSDIIDSYEEAELACLEKLIEIVEKL
jgi:hypothetical protein